jgi:hypothetical protein
MNPDLYLKSFKLQSKGLQSNNQKRGDSRLIFLLLPFRPSKITKRSGLAHLRIQPTAKAELIKVMYEDHLKYITWLLL